MLRIIVISLVVANLLLLAFQSSAPTVQPEARPASAAARNSGIPTIHLFSEMMQDQGLMSGSRRCFTLGPFHSVADWDDVHTRLQKVSTHISERQTEALVEKGYWIYLPPYPSLLEANEALLSLQALGLEDVAIIYDGEWKNSVSLGYFMRQENAQRRKKALEDRGFKPMMRIQRQAEPRFWLDYEQEPGSGLVELDMQNRPNDFMQRPVPCPETEFLDADATISQASGENQAEAQSTGAEPGPVSAGESGPDGSGTPEQSAGATKQPEGDKQQANIEPVADQDAVNGQENAQETNDGQPAGSADNKKAGSQMVNKPGETTDEDGEAAAGQAQATGVDKTVGAATAGEAVKIEDNDVETAMATDSGVTGQAANEPAPKQPVGTGPADIVSMEPEPVETGVEGQDAEDPAGGAPENKKGDGGDEPADDGNGDTTAAPSGDTEDQNAPDVKEKDNENGTDDR